MKKEIKDRWIAALRSGEYQQARRVLHTKDGCFCCLGVLCDLYIKEKNQQWLDGNTYPNISKLEKPPCYEFCGCSCILPTTVMEWAGLDMCNPDIIIANPETGGPQQHGITYVNDTERLTFDKIADLIELQL